jgi:heme/copper-type cytochrome/quinol oxidase subunit 2
MSRAGFVGTLLLSLAAPLVGAAELEVLVSNRGWKPAQIAVRKGETVKVVLSSADREHCFALDALRIEKRVLPGKRTPVEIVADRAGTFAFHCCLEPENEALKGRLIVSE